jgi:LysR family transcriptional regulator, transcriptional activator of the cysJI operon
MSLIDQKLLSFMKIVETNSFTKAAEELALTQPAVSQHIKNLEDELGVKLFIRNHNQLHLTSNGEIVYKYARRLLAVSNNLYQTIKDEKANISSLTVGITHSVESSRVMEALAKYTNISKGLSIKVVTDTIENLHRMIKSFELDFLIINGTIKDPNLDYITMDTDSLVLAVSPTHRLARNMTVSVEELKQEKLILRLPTSNTTSLFDQALNQNNLSITDFDVVLEMENIATIKDLIRQNLGVSVLAKSACMDEIKKGKLIGIPIENMSLIRDTNIVFPKDYENLKTIQDIVELYKLL